MKTKRLLTALLFVGGVISASASDYYVSPEGAGKKDGSSWENAWDLATFRDRASESNSGDSFANNDNVYFAGGKYACASTIWVRWGVQFHGSTGAERTVFTGDTNNDGTADRDRLIRVVTRLNDDRFVTIDNIDFEKYTLNQPSSLTINNYVITNGVGVICINECSATVTIRNCHFSDIANSGNGGGAILARTANLVVDDCSFRNISASSRGAVMRLTSGSNNKGVTTINNCLFEDCAVTTNDAAGLVMLQHGETLTINNSVFKNNTSAGNGGAIYCGKSESSYKRELIINNTLMYNNTAVSGAAVYWGDVSNRSVTYTNCLIDQDNNSNTNIVPAINITNVGVGTYYISAPFTMPEGVTGKTISGAADGKLTIGETYSAGDDVPAGTALYVEGNDGKYYPKLNLSNASAAPTNLLKGSDVAETTTGGNKYYKLANDATYGLGFYWAEDGGAAFTNGAHKAYLALTEAQARFFSLDFDSETTGISTATTKAIRQGKFVENGSIVIVRNGIKYNAQGIKL